MKTNWKEIWVRKGGEETDDLRYLDGWENTSMHPRKVYEDATRSIRATSEDTILDVGCGAGAVGQYFAPAKYVGVDYSSTLLRKHPHQGLSPLHCAEADKLPFANDAFDIVFCYSVFHYFDSLEYASCVIKEMDRVSKGRVFIGDLPESSHNPDHLLFRKDRFGGWNTSEGYYNPERFNIYKNG